jgi:omega-amidase
MSSSPSSTESFKFAAIQLSVVESKEANQAQAKARIEEAAHNGARVISLPECWNSPYSNASFPVYAEPIAEPGSTDNAQVDAASEGASTLLLRTLAKSLNVCIIGGSIPERTCDGSLFNTCTVFGPSGAMLAKYRKMHLFDIDVPGRMTFRESDTLSAGKSLAIFEAGIVAVTHTHTLSLSLSLSLSLTYTLALTGSVPSD